MITKVIQEKHEGVTQPGRIKKLLLFNRIEAFLENFYQKWKNASCGTQFRYFQIKSVQNPFIRLKILTYESPMQSYIKIPSETLGAD